MNAKTEEDQIKEAITTFLGQACMRGLEHLKPDQDVIRAIKALYCAMAGMENLVRIGRTLDQENSKELEDMHQNFKNRLVTILTEKE